MGSLLGPVLANIIMTELEGKIIKRFVDDVTISSMNSMQMIP